MTGSSGVVISNLAYLVGAVVLAVVLGFVVWYRHRPPRSVESNVESFHRGLRALAPDERTIRPMGSTARPASTGLRIHLPETNAERAESETEPASDSAADDDPHPLVVADSTVDADLSSIADGDEAAPVGDEAAPVGEEPDQAPGQQSTAPVVNLTEPAHPQPAAGEAAGDWAGVETG